MNRQEPKVKKGTAIIIGAGPAGLTAAFELLHRTGIKPVLLESTRNVGGLSRTVVHNGNRMDIGGHRFFSKSDRVMQWWLDMLPLETIADEPGRLGYKGQLRPIPQSKQSADAGEHDRVMLVRRRKSRIYFRRRFFDYPIQLTTSTIFKLGILRTLRCGLSYLWSTLRPRRPERTLEDFLVNRFGRQLYLMFYKSYSEKVWGVPCTDISAEWGAQRVKGLSLKSVALHYLRSIFRSKHSVSAARQQETSLIEKFLYPKLGPGQLWEHVAELIRQQGGEIHYGVNVDRVQVAGGKVVSVEASTGSGDRTLFRGDYFLSTMPVRDLLRAMDTVPAEVSTVGEGLCYRDFIIVGLLVKSLAIHESDGSPLQDNWIYLQEPDVKAGRMQIFNNWSPWLVSRPDRVWIGLEYFCNESDPIWRLSDQEMAALAAEEAARIGIIRPAAVEDMHVERIPKSYPAYTGSYSRFDVVRNFTDSFVNLFLIGRNGMHKYNNQDHSMLTAMTAVENIINGVATKENIWAINTEMEYQEEARRSKSPVSDVAARAARKVAVAGTIK
jgi:protoporphyrinogen oxidase